MLRVDVLLLERQEVVLDHEGSPEVLGLRLESGAVQGPLTIHAEIMKSGDVYLARGWVSGTLRQDCDLCLKAFEAPFKSFFESHYQERNGTEREPETADLELTGQETEIVLFDGKTLDLTDEVRQAVEMAVPMRAQCREDCRGLCAGCGADLNCESCRCSDPPQDDRWSALKGFKPDR